MDTKATTHKGTFAWLAATQFLGALNDNIFRWLILFFLIGKLGADQSSRLSVMIGVLFVIPFLLFTPVAGKLADRFSKSHIIVLTKVWELGLMTCACLALFLDWTYAMYALLFAMCTQSAFFGPCKYGIIPELVSRDRLSQANASIQGLTYLAVVLGTAGAGLLSQMSSQDYGKAGFACVGLAVIGLFVSFRIQKTPPIGQKNPSSVFFVKDVVDTMKSIWPDKALVMAVFASAYFMLLGGFLQLNLIPYGIHTLGFNESQSAYLFVIAAVGIGVGSFIAGRLSGRSVELGIVPLGALGLATMSIVLAGLNADHKFLIFATIALMGVSSGLFIVPVQALIQLRSPDATRGQIVAASGFIGWVGVLLAAGLQGTLTELLHLTSSESFLVLGLLTLVLAGLALWKLPDFFVRFVFMAITKTLYRIKVVNWDRIPASGPALLVPNHVSWVDAVLIGTCGQRRVRFIMSRDIFEASKLKFLYRLMDVILISEADPPKQIVQSIRTARQALDDGFLVCIFAEGAITRNGMMQTFKGGMERIVKGTDCPIIPVYLGGVWGSIFSYFEGKIGGKPRQIPYPVSIHVGTPMPSTSTAFEVRQKVAELSCDYFDDLKHKDGTLPEQFIRTARKHWTRPCVADATGKDLTYGRTLIGSVLLSEKLAPHTQSTQNVGIMLPPCAAGVLANVAVGLLGKTSVNLSYVVPDSVRDHAMAQAQVQHVITSRAFLEKLELETKHPMYLFVEDLIKDIPSGQKAKAWLKARFLPLMAWREVKSVDPDSIATILFSSGSTGTPKGVMLSHHNLASNLKSINMVYKVHAHDKIGGVLPFFHVFGLNVTLWLPITVGASAFYIPNPLDGKAVAQNVRDHGVTLLLATPTFLYGYMRRASSEDFATLRSVILGAEKMNPKLADLFEKKFGVRPQEGYGTTELSPLVSINLANVDLDGLNQIGTQSGSVGQSVPGVAVKVVTPETHEPLGMDRAGLLLVKGPNVMTGYLNAPDQTRDVIRDGWYQTGDVASINAAGFITITDRLSRFSKIGGEMVSHGKVEEICVAATQTDERVIVVTSRTHETKGEELVVLYVQEKVNPTDLIQAVRTSDLPNLSKPKPDNFMPVETIPLLGSGKPDFMKIKTIVNR
ncbi:MAG: MFS transporter [Phycisphaeraceae bacterium]|nr:MFS transporter [Phycisphaeraceae bacterium]